MNVSEPYACFYIPAFMNLDTDYQIGQCMQRYNDIDSRK
jgi:hypothetical protein